MRRNFSCDAGTLFISNLLRALLFSPNIRVAGRCRLEPRALSGRRSAALLRRRLPRAAVAAADERTPFPGYPRIRGQAPPFEAFPNSPSAEFTAAQCGEMSSLEYDSDDSGAMSEDEESPARVRLNQLLSGETKLQFKEDGERVFCPLCTDKDPKLNLQALLQHARDKSTGG